MHINIFTLALCLLSTASPVAARPTSSVIARRNVNLMGATVHPVRLRRRGNARLQLQQLSCSTAPVGENQEEAAAGEGAAGEEEAVESKVDDWWLLRIT